MPAAALFDQSILDEYQSAIQSAQSTQPKKEPAYFYSFQSLAQMRRVAHILPVVKKSCSIHIEHGYIKAASQKLGKDPTYDLVIGLDQDIHSIPPKQMTDHVIGILISELGECKTQPKIHSVRLVCSCSNKGALLLGAYLYSIAKNPNVLIKKAILELAHGYLNPSGLCLYGKFGFENKPDLSSTECFSDLANLPMIASLDNYGATIDVQCSKIVAIVLKQDAGFQKHYLCGVKGGVYNNSKSVNPSNHANPGKYVIEDARWQKIIGAILNTQFLLAHMAPDKLKKTWVGDTQVDYAFIHEAVDVDDIVNRTKSGKSVHKPAIDALYDRMFPAESPEVSAKIPSMDISESGPSVSLNKKESLNAKKPPVRRTTRTTHAENNKHKTTAKINKRKRSLSKSPTSKSSIKHTRRSARIR